MHPVIHWFRRDLRLVDSPSLVAAAAAGPVVPLFIVDPTFAGAGAPRRAFMADALAALDDAMDRTLVYRHGNPVEQLCRLVADTGARDVFAAADFGPYGRRRDRLVASRLHEIGVGFHLVGSPYVVDPGRVRTAGDLSYSVFTPFRRTWERMATRPSVAGTSAGPSSLAVTWRGAPTVSCDGPPSRPAVRATWAAATPDGARLRLESFISGGLDRYDEQRDLPGVEGTSRLSADLRWGLIHPCQILDRLGDSRAHDVFRSEIAWREFYADVLFHHPRSTTDNLRPQWDRMPVDTDARAVERFAAWRAGATGYPIVDAGMRQLAATGWMHNRVRMLAASFLVKDLHLPWQWGAGHFMSRLIDGDLASNSHGWQWSAGSGTDAAPYFRIFNPVTQSQRFDADGAYIRRWVPELSGVDARDVHAPWTSRRGLPAGYPAPIVDHAAERVEALRRYALVSRQ